jgi:hypothetical protein
MSGSERERERELKHRDIGMSGEMEEGFVRRSRTAKQAYKQNGVPGKIKEERERERETRFLGASIVSRWL